MNLMKKWLHQPEMVNNVPERLNTPSKHPELDRIFPMSVSSSARPLIATAEEIQKDLVSTSDGEMAEMRSLLTEQGIDPRARALMDLGFVGVDGVTQEMERTHKEEAAKVALSHEQKCAARFPGLKFISTSAMGTVCEKYGLLLGGVDRFTGVVPDWAIDRIKSSGVPTRRYFVDHRWNSGYRSGKPKEIRRQEKEERKVQEGFRNDKRLQLHHSDQGASQWCTYDLAVAKEYANGNYLRSEPTLMIAAPAAEMSVNAQDRIQGHLILTGPMDPIVCYPMTGGFAIVCAWGEEGQDPRVFNADNN